MHPVNPTTNLSCVPEDHPPPPPTIQLRTMPALSTSSANLLSTASDVLQTPPPPSYELSSSPTYVTVTAFSPPFRSLLSLLLQGCLKRPELLKQPYKTLPAPSSLQIIARYASTLQWPAFSHPINTPCKRQSLSPSTIQALCPQGVPLNYTHHACPKLCSHRPEKPASIHQGNLLCTPKHQKQGYQHDMSHFNDISL